MNNSWTKSRLPSLSATNLFFRKQLWIWPLIAAAILGATAWWLRGKLEVAMNESLVTQLQTILDADVTALDIWFNAQESNVKGVASDHDVERVVTRLVDEAADLDPADFKKKLAKPVAELQEQIDPHLNAHGFVGYLLIDRKGQIIASSNPELIGDQSLASLVPNGREVAEKKATPSSTLPPDYVNLFKAVSAGKVLVTRPYPSSVMLSDEKGELRRGVPTMIAAAPVHDSDGKVIAILGMRIRPEIDFTRILSVARMGETGETYACNDQGMLLSESRFDDDLKEFGLLNDRPDVRSIFQLVLRDPEANFYLKEVPPRRASERGLTVPAQGIQEHSSGSDLKGYRDYRGVPSIGAWRWLPERNFGVVTELDQSQGLKPLYAVRLVFWALFGLLLLASVAIFVYSIVVARLERTARRSALEAKRLGQYVLDEKIGEGGMGAVYRAHHAMLRRPTAVKLISEEKTTPTAIARFEREVQLTSQLNHPNTIAIYDYGRTPEGVFYYAMELLDGLSLQSLVERFGPLPDERVIKILRQVCGSLAEAHGGGLIHRDIKPANIMLTARGGVADFVKLLDFGLVKAVDNRTLSNITMAQGLTGTPLYMAPEAIEEAFLVDARTDLYALGAVGYFLLTGTPVFEGTSLLDICRQHVETPPQSPTRRLGRPVSADLEAVILQCLAKDQSARPQTAKELDHQLAACGVLHVWTSEDAADWWRHLQQTALATTAVLPTRSGETDATETGELS